MVYACGIIKIRHRKVEFITGMKTKSVVGRSKKRPVIGYHLWIAPNQDSSFETNIFNIHFIKYLLSPLNGLDRTVGKAYNAYIAAQYGHGFESSNVKFCKIFFFIIGGKGCAHPKVFRLTQP